MAAVLVMMFLLLVLGCPQKALSTSSQLLIGWQQWWDHLEKRWHCHQINHQHTPLT